MAITTRLDLAQPLRSVELARTVSVPAVASGVIGPVDAFLSSPTSPLLASPPAAGLTLASAGAPPPVDAPSTLTRIGQVAATSAAMGAIASIPVLGGLIAHKPMTCAADGISKLGVAMGVAGQLASYGSAIAFFQSPPVALGLCALSAGLAVANSINMAVAYR